MDHNFLTLKAFAFYQDHNHILYVDLQSVLSMTMGQYQNDIFWRLPNLDLIYLVTLMNHDQNMQLMVILMVFLNMLNILF